MLIKEIVIDANHCAILRRKYQEDPLYRARPTITINGIEKKIVSITTDPVTHNALVQYE